MEILEIIAEVIINLGALFFVYKLLTHKDK